MKKIIFLWIILSSLSYSKVKFEPNFRLGLLAPKNPGVVSLGGDFVFSNKFSTYLSAGFPSAALIGFGVGIHENYYESGFNANVGFGLIVKFTDLIPTL